MRIASEYHTIPKGSESYLPDRALALSAFFNMMSTKEVGPLDVRFHKEISRLAALKSNYLMELDILYRTGVLTQDQRIYDREVVSPYFNAFSSSNRFFRPLRMNNKSRYDSLHGRPWGHFWLEAIDPCHRPLEELENKWLETRNSKKTPDFFLWLEMLPVTSYHKRIAYYTRDKLKECALTVRDGRIYSRAKGITSLFTTDDKSENIMIINDNGQILSTTRGKEDSHASISHGRSVIAAGTFDVRAGLILKLEATSGHYLPSEFHARQMIIALAEAGILFHHNPKMVYYKRGYPTHTDCKSLLKSSNRSYSSSLPIPPALG